MEWFHRPLAKIRIALEFRKIASGSRRYGSPPDYGLDSVMSTTSLSILPREQASCLPSFDQSNQKI